MKWFNNCKSVEDVKAEYKRLIKQYHPDISGADTTAQMQEINAEYDIVFERLKNVHKTAEGKTYTAKTETAETPEQFKQIIETLMKCEGLLIDLVGNWIWLRGETFRHKEVIKSLGFHWSGSKRMWYWRADENASGRHKSTDYNKIKERYGCETFQAEGKAKLQGA